MKERTGETGCSGWGHAGPEAQFPLDMLEGLEETRQARGQMQLRLNSLQGRQSSFFPHCIIKCDNNLCWSVSSELYLCSWVGGWEVENIMHYEKQCVTL